jgi:hypothetical protein
MPEAARLKTMKPWKNKPRWLEGLAGFKKLVE